MKGRKKPNLSEKLASALLELKVADEAGNLVPVIEREEAKKMTAQQIIHRFECDHWPIPVAHGGSNHPTNLKWREKGEHREKTSKIDIPMIAKSKRIEDAHEEFRRRMTQKRGVSHSSDEQGAGGNAPQRAKNRWPSRPLRSRNFRKKKGDADG